MPNTIRVNNFIFSVSSDAFLGGDFSLFKNEKNPLVALSYNTFNEIDLLKEIDGAERHLAALTMLSHQTSSTVFCGVKTQIMGLKHISVAICHRGRLIDIVDRTVNPFGDEFENSEKIKIFSTDLGRVAVLVDTDVLIEKNWQKTYAECDIVLNILSLDSEEIFAAALGLAEQFKKPILIVGNGEVAWKERE